MHVATGAVHAAGHDLTAGDAFTVDEASEVTLRATEPAQVVWFDLA